MKYLVVLLIVLSLFLSGCGNDMTLYKQDEVAAVESCQKNGGYRFYKLERHTIAPIPHTMAVACNDGAVFILGSKITQQKYKGGGKNFRWESTSSYEWLVVDGRH